MRYDFQAIESRWQAYWAEHGTFRAPSPGERGFDPSRPKFYVLDMFPYPSGVGLHVGHPLGYIATDIVARYRRMLGDNVLHPMGFDAFGLPAEQYAIETGVHPRETTEKNIANMRRQLQRLGLSYDWDRELATTDVGYYRWTQWIFLQLYHAWYDPRANEGRGAARPIDELVAALQGEDYLIDTDANLVWTGDEENLQAVGGDPIGVWKWHELDAGQQRRLLDEYRLAYLAEVPVNWCPNLGTVLANEEVTADGRSERGNHPVEKRPLRQWMLRITKYADRLADELDQVDWPEPIKLLQRNWVGRSTGAEVDFAVASNDFASNEPRPSGSGVGESQQPETPLPHGRGSSETITVFTTRPDTLFGATYMVLAPEHPLVAELVTDEQREAVREYREQAARKSEIDRQAETRDKTGVPTGAYAINPVNGERIPIWVADYVMMGYGTGAIMAVPAHDTRDYEFAKAFGLPIRIVVADPSEYDGVEHNLPLLSELVAFCETEGLRYAIIGGLAHDLHAGRLTPWHSDVDLAIDRRDLDALRTKLHALGLREEPADRSFWNDTLVFSSRSANRWLEVCLIDVEEDAVRDAWGDQPATWGPRDSAMVRKRVEGVSYRVASAETLADIDMRMGRKDDLEPAYVGNGLLIHSANDEVSLNGLGVAEAKARITDWLEAKGLGRAKVQYKLRDWLFSRQRYWGEPFPILHELDERGRKTGVIRGVPEDQLPVELPPMPDFKAIAPGGGEADTPAAGEPQPPLSRAPDRWKHVELDGKRYVREFNTMPQWAGSCWYYLRFCDPMNDARFVGDEAERYWMGGDASDRRRGGVDLYVGGAEHAVLHLLYARFWHKVLYDLGHVSTPEPFGKLFNQGYIQAHAYTDDRGVYVPAEEVVEKDGRFYYGDMEVTCEFGKMGKSLKNAVAPDDIAEQYGCDTLRLYEMYLGPLDQSKVWNTQDIVGVHRFLNRLWRNLVHTDTGELLVEEAPADDALLKLTHRTIARVTDAMDAMAFNVAIAALIELNNALVPLDRVPRWVAEQVVRMLSPLAPHLAEELWAQLGHAPPVANRAWPTHDPELLVEDEIELPVQVMGKLRGKITVPQDADEATILEAAKAEPNVAAHLAGKTIRKTIVVPGKLVNLVAN